MSIAAEGEDFFPISEWNEIYNNEYVIGEFTFKWFEKVVWKFWKWKPHSV